MSGLTSLEICEKEEYMLNIAKGLAWFENQGQDYGVQCHFQKYFSYIATVSFIGGGNRSTWRKPQTCRKSLTNFITKNVVSSTPRH